MTFIDTNLTYSKQVCDYAIGGIMGAGTILYLLGRLLIILLGFYLVYRVTQIFLVKYSIKLNNLKDKLKDVNNGKK